MFGFGDAINNFNRGYSYEAYVKAAIITLGKYLKINFNEDEFKHYFDEVFPSILQEAIIEEKVTSQAKIDNLKGELK